MRGLAASRLNHRFSLLSRDPPYARERRLSKTQIPQCTKCTKKTQNTQCTRCTKGGRWKIEERWKMGGGFGRLAAGSRMASHPLRRRAYGGQASALAIGWRKGEAGLRVGQWD